MRKRRFPEVEVDEKEKQKFIRDQIDLLSDDTNLTRDKDEIAVQEETFEKLAELARVVERVRKETEERKRRG
jgi:hypothetical protein